MSHILLMHTHLELSLRASKNMDKRKTQIESIPLPPKTTQLKWSHGIEAGQKQCMYLYMTNPSHDGPN